ncbi:MAG: naphthoate synthase [Subtercola sp.]|nr:naphthoate synthase [Subtercola sp.]
MEYTDITLEVEDYVATITLNRPEKRNAMSLAMTREMPHVLEALRYRKDVRVVVITGAGDAFCAGADLKEFFYDLLVDKDDDWSEFEYYLKLMTEWRARTLYYYPKPTIAMINGWCFGGAFPIVEGCDLAIAADEAQFGLSEVNFDIFPGGTAGKSVSRVMRPKDALWYSLTAEVFDGKKAAELGFINKSVPLAELKETTMQLAKSLAAKNPMALKATKQVVRNSLEMTWEAAVDYAYAKEKEVTLATAGAWLKHAIPDFQKGLYKPGLEGHESVTAQESTDK